MGINGIILFTSWKKFSKIYLVSVAESAALNILQRRKTDMKKNLFAIGLIIGALILGGVFTEPMMAATEPKSVDVMFLHDTHSHLNEFATVEDGESQVLGGFAKIKTLIKAQKEENPNTLLLDAGDFSMGTFIQVVYEE